MKQKNPFLKLRYSLFRRNDAADVNRNSECIPRPAFGVTAGLARPVKSSEGGPQSGI
jgi:hypothetical protein